MPVTNLGRLHLTAAQKTAIDAALTTIETQILAVTMNLNAEERNKFGSVNEANKLFVNKDREYYQTQPTLASPDVDWVEFEADYQDRIFADTRLDRIATITRMFSDFKIVHDFDNFQDGLDDYRYSKYKASTKAPGFSEKVEELKQFFPNTNGGGSGDGTSAE